MHYKSFKGRSFEGEIIHMEQFDRVFPFLREGKTVFVLTRTHRLAARVAEQLVQAGIPFRDLGDRVHRSPWTKEFLGCTNALVNIAHGREPTPEQREDFKKYLPKPLANDLGDHPILTFFRSRIDQLDVHSILRLLRLSPRAGRALWNYGITASVPYVESEKIPVALGTIHASKGLQAPTVVLLTDVTGEAARAFHGLEPHCLGQQNARLPEERRDEEKRLLFVGVTRAMERLVITHIGKGATYGL